jgi:hypothetical protein
VAVAVSAVVDVAARVPTVALASGSVTLVVACSFVALASGVDVASLSSRLSGPAHDNPATTTKADVTTTSLKRRISATFRMISIQLRDA